MILDGLLVVQHIDLMPNGKKRQFFRSAFKRIDWILQDGYVSVHAQINEDVADKVHRRQWEELEMIGIPEQNYISR